MIDDIKDLYHRSKVTFTFLAIMVIYFIVLTLNGGSTNGEVLLKFGAFYPPAIIVYKEFYRFITSIFMHIGISHLFFNGYALYALGPQIERLMGWKKYLGFFLLSGIGGNLLSFIFAFNTLSAGASGSLFGIFGAFLYLVVRHPHMVTPGGKKAILTNLVINLVLTLVVPSISITAHLGGLVIGFLLSFIFIG